MFGVRARTGIWSLAFAIVLVAIGAMAAPRSVQAASPYTMSMSFQQRTTTCTKAVAESANAVASISADGAAATYGLCIYVEDSSTGLPVSGGPVEVRTLVGTIGVSGTARYSGFLFTSSSGVATISYRGDGKSFGGDTAIGYYAGTRAVATSSMLLTPAAGRYPTQIAVMAPGATRIASTRTDSLNRYVSPTSGVNVAAQVQDMNQLGVNDQVVLIRADGAMLVSNPGFAQTVTNACAGVTTRALVLTTNATNSLVPSGVAMPGSVDFVVCADTERIAGDISVYVQVVSAVVPNAVLTLEQVGRPAAISASFDGMRLAARVTDVNGRPVVDGTPVQFVLPDVGGALSAPCSTTSKGVASVVAAVGASTATAAVSAGYNESGVAASCAVAGARLISGSVSVGADTANGARAAISE